VGRAIALLAAAREFEPIHSPFRTVAPAPRSIHTLLQLMFELFPSFDRCAAAVTTMATKV